jgi:hypothetical protein
MYTDAKHSAVLLTLGQTILTKDNLTQRAIIWATPGFKGVASLKA